MGDCGGICTGLCAAFSADGEGGVLESLYDRPAFLEEMIEFWVGFACDLARPGLERLAVDFATVEDGLCCAASWRPRTGRSRTSSTPAGSESCSSTPAAA